MRGRKPKYSAKMINEAKKMRAKGYDKRAISKHLGMNYWAVYYHTSPNAKAIRRLSVDKYRAKLSRKK